MLLLKRLEKYLKNSETKMTQERYFKMCEQMAKEPIEDEIPPDINDFPEIAVSALEVFSNLGLSLIHISEPTRLRRLS